MEIQLSTGSWPQTSPLAGLERLLRDALKRAPQLATKRVEEVRIAGLRVGCLSRSHSERSESSGHRTMHVNILGVADLRDGLPLHLTWFC